MSNSPDKDTSMPPTVIQGQDLSGKSVEYRRGFSAAAESTASGAISKKRHNEGFDQGWNNGVGAAANKVMDAAKAEFANGRDTQAQEFRLLARQLLSLKRK